MEHLTIEELLTLVGLPLAAIATIAGIFVVSHKRGRVALVFCLGVWMVIAGLLVSTRVGYEATLRQRLRAEIYEEAERREAERQALTEAAVQEAQRRIAEQNRRKAIADSAARFARLRDSVRLLAREQLFIQEEMEKERQRVLEERRIVREERHRAQLDANRVRLIGRWSGVLPSSGGNPAGRTILTFHDDGRMEEDSSLPNGNWYQRYVLRTATRSRSNVRYQVSGLDSITVTFRHSIRGQMRVKAAYSFVGPDTLVLSERVLGQEVVLRLGRVRNTR
ncbi:MAG TPA: hypothetical protein VHG08_01465 [Longimicrobium sp.]|nr:hypothetical protein [Longimicrobium sp.]